MKNKILIKARYTDDGNGYDSMYLDDKYIFSTSEFVECPEDSIYTRDAISSKDALNLTTQLFSAAGLSFDDYFELEFEYDD